MDNNILWRSGLLLVLLLPVYGFIQLGVARKTILPLTALEQANCNDFDAGQRVAGAPIDLTLEAAASRYPVGDGLQQAVGAAYRDGTLSNTIYECAIFVYDDEHSAAAIVDNWCQIDIDQKEALRFTEAGCQKEQVPMSIMTRHENLVIFIFTDMGIYKAQELAMTLFTRVEALAKRYETIPQ